LQQKVKRKREQDKINTERYQHKTLQTFGVDQTYATEKVVH
jgi:hypothetical protein